MLMRWLKRIVCMLILTGLFLGGAVWYVKPVENLDLSYRPVSVREKLTGMLLNRSPEIVLSEDDLNQLLKQQLAERRHITPNVEIIGARFEQDGQHMTAHVNVLYGGRFEVGAVLEFHVDWQRPNLTATHLATRIKRLSVPDSLFHLEPIVIPVEELLPPLVSLKGVRFLPNGVGILFQLK